jgi:hypothetical protein
MRIDHTLLIKAPATVVWGLTIDVERWPELTPTTITEVRRLDAGPLQVGSTARLRQPMQRPRVWTVVEVVELERFVWDARMGTVRMRGEHHLEATGAWCRNTLVLELTGAGSRVLGRLARRQFAKVLATENAGFARVAESAVAAVSADTDPAEITGR